MKAELSRYDPMKEPQIIHLTGTAAKMFSDVEQGDSKKVLMALMKKGYDVDIDGSGKPTVRCSLLITSIDEKNIKESDSMEKMLHKTATEMGVKTEKGMMEDEE